MGLAFGRHCKCLSHGSSSVSAPRPYKDPETVMTLAILLAANSFPFHHILLTLFRSYYPILLNSNISYEKGILGDLRRRVGWYAGLLGALARFMKLVAFENQGGDNSHVEHPVSMCRLMSICRLLQCKTMSICRLLQGLTALRRLLRGCRSNQEAQPASLLQQHLNVACIFRENLHPTPYACVGH